MKIETFNNETPDTSDVVLCKHCGELLHSEEDDVFWEDSQDHLCVEMLRKKL